MDNQLITLLRITTPQLGSFVKDKLEEHGIEVFFTNEGMTLGDTYNPDEVLLKVKAYQSEKAVARLIQLQKDYDLDKVKDDVSFAKFKKILVPVKLSEDCNEVCKYAIGLAKKQHAEIKILYVYPDPSIDVPERHSASWEKYVKMELKEAFQNAQLKLVNFSKELKKQIPAEIFDSVKVHYRMLKGTPVNVITSACKRYNPDVILMATKKSNKKEGEFLGKTMLKVIEETHYPVLAVPHSAVFKGKDVINVMYATDFYNSDNKSLNTLLGLLKSFNKNIYCVHIDLNDDAKRKEKINELNTMLQKEYSQHNIRCELFESKSITKGINDFVIKNDIDIISLSKVKRSAFYRMFHTDLVEKLLTVETVPILIFPV